ncbi:MAG: hypothetical protein GX154_00150 [Clostridiales bacterium]|nr:hypothetical protein [Clostridiales bacterium]
MITIHVSPKLSKDAIHIAKILLNNGEQITVLPKQRKQVEDILAGIKNSDADVKVMGKTMIITPLGQ